MHWHTLCVFFANCNEHKVHLQLKVSNLLLRGKHLNQYYLAYGIYVIFVIVLTKNLFNIESLP